MAYEFNVKREWRRQTSDGEYVILTDATKFNLKFVNEAFATEDMFWAKVIPEDQIRTMLANSFNLGLYKVLPAVPAAKNSDSPSSPRTPSPTIEGQPAEQLQQVGLARYVTDYITWAYLTDVYIHPEHRGTGLGKWLIACCNEILGEIPSLRRALLLTTVDVGRRFYTREMGFHDVLDEREYLACMTRKTYKMGGN